MKKCIRLIGSKAFESIILITKRLKYKLGPGGANIIPRDIKNLQYLIPLQTLSQRLRKPILQ